MHVHAARLRVVEPRSSAGVQSAAASPRAHRVLLARMQGLLVAFSNPPADEDAFNAWYDEEHVPLRRAVPGFLSGRRYKASGDDAGPRYAALYELASVAVLESEPYLRLWREQSERDRNML